MLFITLHTDFHIINTITQGLRKPKCFHAATTKLETLILCIKHVGIYPPYDLIKRLFILICTVLNSITETEQAGHCCPASHSWGQLQPGPLASVSHRHHGQISCLWSWAWSSDNKETFSLRAATGNLVTCASGPHAQDYICPLTPGIKSAFYDIIRPMYLAKV